MKEIVAELGEVFLNMLPVIFITVMVLGMIRTGGVVNDVVAAYMTGLTG